MTNTTSTEVGVDVGAFIRDMRRRHGLSQRQLAIRAGTDQATISRIERGREGVTVARLGELLLAMGRRLVVDSVPLQLPQDRVDLAANRRAGPAAALRKGMRLSAFGVRLRDAGARAKATGDDGG